MNISNLSKQDILSIKKDQVKKIFSGVSLKENKIIYKKLSILWHPDKRLNDKDADQVFSHINALYHYMVDNFKEKKHLNVLNIKCVNGKEFNLNYIKTLITEIGQLYVCHHYIAYFISNDDKETVLKGIENISNLSFDNNKMKEQFEKYIPNLFRKIETFDGIYLIFKKEKRFINLLDVYNFLNKKIDPKHTAWIISSIYNLICFIHHNDLMHGGISIENIYIDPATHETMIIGGWWYSAKHNQKLSILSNYAYNVSPKTIIENKKADKLIDLIMIKLLGKTLLGDHVGTKLINDKSIPSDLVKWFRVSSLGSSIKDYTYWMNHVLIDSFGERKFVELKLSAKDIY